MGEDEVLFDSRETKSRMDVSDFLANLASAMKQGTLELHEGDQNVSMSLPDELNVEVELDEDTDDPEKVGHSLEIEIEWVEGGS
jgi:amphi-Trp domain-containing protein